jgi:hypothetical protein
VSRRRVHVPNSLGVCLRRRNICTSGMSVTREAGKKERLRKAAFAGAEPALRVGAGVEYRDVWICTFGKRTSGILASAVPHSTVCRLNC